MTKTIAAIIALAALAGPAVAQGSAPAATQAPTLAQCKAGYKDGMHWTKDQFATACQKVMAQNKGG